MKIVTDSAADLPAADIEALDIRVAPLSIQMPEGEIKSSDVTPDEFYNRLTAMFPQIPTTAQPSPGLFADMYRELAQQDPDILSVHISLGLSGTPQSATLAGTQVPEANVTVVDTMTLSGGERFQVLAAALGAKAGWSKDKIVERLGQIREATELAYTLETLTYLEKGGRIGRVQALAGAIFKIKPVIRVDSDGKYSTVGKGRTLQRTRQMMVDHLVAMYGQEPLWVTVLNGQMPDQAEAFAAELQAALNVAKLESERVSPVLGVHTGPGIVGVGVVPIKFFEGLDLNYR